MSVGDLTLQYIAWSLEMTLCSFPAKNPLLFYPLLFGPSFIYISVQAKYNQFPLEHLVVPV